MMRYTTIYYNILLLYNNNTYNNMSYYDIVYNML